LSEPEEVIDLDPAEISGVLFRADVEWCRKKAWFAARVLGYFCFLACFAIITGETGLIVREGWPPMGVWPACGMIVGLLAIVGVVLKIIWPWFFGDTIFLSPEGVWRNLPTGDLHGFAIYNIEALAIEPDKKQKWWTVRQAPDTGEKFRVPVSAYPNLDQQVDDFKSWLNDRDGLPKNCDGVYVMEPDGPSPKRRRFQYSLRSLLIVMTLVAFGCSWFAVQMKKSRERANAMERIEEAAGEGPIFFAGGNLTDELFGNNPIGVQLDNTPVTNEALPYLEGLPSIEIVSLRNTQIDDAGLVHLKTLTKLRSLDLRNTKVTDGGVAELRRSLPNCKISR